MAYTLGNKCTKNCCDAILVQLIVEEVVAWFFWNSVIQIFPPTIIIYSLKITMTLLQCTVWPLSRQCEIPWRFAALLRSTRHVTCYSYHACTSVTVSGGGGDFSHDISLTFSKIPDISLTVVKFPDISRFSRQVVSGHPECIILFMQLRSTKTII